MPEKFYVDGYDKDGDVYQTICETSTPERAMEIASAVIRYHNAVEQMRRKDNNEPFDWFVISDDDDNILKIFTPEEPDGFIPA